jgi:predicted RecA/RadA family phage recombinase
VVKLDGDSAEETVEPSDADGEVVYGVALHDAAAGEQVTVARDGTKVRATSGTGSVASGELVASHGATGEEGEVASAASGDYVLGVAVADDAGTNDDVRVEINLGGQVN